jgi:ribosomal protein L11 methyltransferase
MNYYKYNIVLTPDNQEFREIVIASFGDLGFESFVEQEDKIEAYLPENNKNVSDDLINELSFSPMFEYAYSKELIKDQNWNEEWEKNYFKPLLIADKCLVRAPFHTDYPNAEYEIIIEPNMAFGTGNHETTSLMIEHLLEMDLNAKSLLDMGCGTGILSILASMKGCSSIVAVDIDKWAYEGTIENSKLNNIDNIEALIGDVSSVENTHFDIVLANIHKNVLIDDMPKYKTLLNKNGLLIMSGFYDHDLVDIERIAVSLGFKSHKKKIKNRWVAIAYLAENTK